LPIVAIVTILTFNEGLYHQKMGNMAVLSVPFSEITIIINEILAIN
jgi:hypothetical protein